MRRPTVSWPALNRQAPYVIAFVLPLGFFGVAGVVLAPLYALVNLRTFLRLSWRPVLIALPFAVITVVSAVRSGDGANQLASAVGMALLFTIGFQSVRLLAKQSDPDKLIAAFLAGSLVLAASVALDFALGWNQLPSGLFLDPSLHNWAGTLLALAFPLALHLASRPRYRAFGFVAAVELIAGVVLALSWVGMLGLLVGALAMGLSRGRALAWAPLVACVLAAGSYGLWKDALAGPFNKLRVREYSLAEWEYVAVRRTAIFRDGIRLGLTKPWLGWGFSSHYESLAEVPGLVGAKAKLTDSGAQGTNLLRASEALNHLPWIAFQARVTPNAAIAPNGTKTADTVEGRGVEGQRMLQHIPVVPGGTLSYTFAIWARTEQGANDLALALRDAGGRTDNVLSLSTGPEGKLLDNRAVRFELDEEWRRVWITATFRTPIRDSIQVLAYLDGYYTGHSGDDQFMLWGAQLNSGTTPLPYSSVHSSGAILDMRQLAHFHSWFVQTLFETGLLGLAALLGLLTWLFTRLTGPVGTPLCAALLAFVVTQLFDYAAIQSSIVMSVLLVGTLIESVRRTARANSVRSSSGRRKMLHPSSDSIRG